MKQVTIDNVRERIAELDCLDKAGVISLRGGFELACLRALVDGKPLVGSRYADGIDPYMSNAACLREINEALGGMDITMFSQVATGINDMKSELTERLRIAESDRDKNGWYVHECSRLEREIERHAQPAPVVPGDLVASFTRTRLLEIIVTGPDASGAEQNALARIALALMPPEAQEAATDNTAQQFEALATSQPQQSPVSLAISDVIAERQRQISAEGWTPAHDDTHDNNEMAFAAACYAFHAAAASWDLEDCGTEYDSHPVPKNWPWEPEWWKPKSARSDLVRAGALILAEIERLDRMATSAWSGKQ